MPVARLPDQMSSCVLPKYTATSQLHSITGVPRNFLCLEVQEQSTLLHLSSGRTLQGSHPRVFAHVFCERFAGSACGRTLGAS